jgi:hypothetical protein
LRDVFVLEPKTKISTRESYIRSYRAINAHFASIAQFDADAFIVTAHVVYGWMPTILELAADSDEDIEAAVSALNESKSGSVTDRDLALLIRIVNNSLVGTSKLLHFASPAHFAIWDSRVYSFVFDREPYHYRMNNIADYREYHTILGRIAGDTRFLRFHEAVNDKVGYRVSPLRAIELIMYNNSR